MKVKPNLIIMRIRKADLTHKWKELRISKIMRIIKIMKKKEQLQG